MTYKITSDKGEREFESKDEWKDMQDLLDDQGVEYEAYQNGNEATRSGTPVEPDTETETGAEAERTEPQAGSAEPQEAEVVDAQDTSERGGTPVTKPEQLSKDPIGFLERINQDFTNTIKGKPAISKQGFRFIQREFKISTESEVVQWSEDPLGCVVWAKAELDDGYSAEAHGEGYQFERDVSDNEFVRYADSRAKNRAISDLTAAGALAVEELQGEQ